ncbi:hypothetical protein [Kangiella shandongensis]|uniref:hypothetical protein n=1 Tax=Kangiella shandongensis TaxID=2763258 RepID=UPI001CBAC3D3|nr:hypothetical protein [Kangiella shandongensis]
MKASTPIKALLVWFIILVLAVMNGLLREALLTPLFGVPSSFIISGILLSLLIMLVSYITIPWLVPRNNWQLVAIGFGWLSLTIVFEFSLGLWQGKKLALILEAYTFKNGNLWPLILLVTVCSPYIAAKMRGILPANFS